MQINIGCGRRVLPGWINVDLYPSDSAVLKGDICAGIPELKTAVAREILLDNVIEHVADIPRAMREIERLSCPGASITIITPHFSSADSWTDPTHRWHLALGSLNYFCGNENNNRYSEGLAFEMVEVKLSFQGGLMGLCGRCIYSLNPKLWERKFSFIFRASTITYLLRRI